MYFSIYTCMSTFCIQQVVKGVAEIFKIGYQKKKIMTENDFE